MYEEEHQGFSEPPKKSVCVTHFTDFALQSYAQKIAQTGTCSYCGAKSKVVPLRDMVERIAGKIREYFDHPDNQGVGYDSSDRDEDDGLNHEYGYVFDGRHIYDTERLLLDELALYDDVDNEELFNDIAACIPEQLWCQKDPYGMTEDEEMSFKWRTFCEEVKHRRRYTFFQLPEFDNPRRSDNGLSDILTEISRVVHAARLIRPVLAGEKVYRCRNHKSDEAVDKDKELVSPLPQQAVYPNRMSPAGIPMFYGGFDPEIVREEAQGESAECQTVGEFELKEKINVIDFTRLPKVSFWGDDALEPVRFLNSFVGKLSKPIGPDDAHIEYVPTQILTEHFRYNFLQEGVRGMIYGSAKCKGSQCCVLFFDQAECLEKMKMTKIEKFTPTQKKKE